MRELARSPRWVVATLVVVGVCAVFVALGLWQLRRHEERSVENRVAAARLASEPTDLLTAVVASGPDLESLDHRPVWVGGTFEPAGEILVRSQVENGRPGFHVVTPLRTTDGTVLVNRGWVPLSAGDPPVVAAAPPSGVVTVRGLARASQVRPGIGPVEPPGHLDVVARIDLDRLGGQFPDLIGVWVQQTDPTTDALPVRVEPPETDDPGPHLAYAIQWFSFAVITVVGFGLLARRSTRGGE